MRSISILLFLTFRCLGFVMAQDERPNIIFILTDDQRWDALGYAGNPIIQTPEMDRLAKDGTYFSNAFVTTPICAASRASIITGLFERKHGYTFQQPPLRKAFIEESYFAMLRKVGYYNGFSGKMGVHFEQRLDTSLFDVYKPEQQSGYFQLVKGATTHEHLTDKMGNTAIDFIKNAPANVPFALSLSFNAPHAVDSSPNQYFWPQATDTMYRNITIPPPLSSRDMDFDELPGPVKKGFNRTRWKWRYDNPEKYQKMVKGYYRMISGIDIVIGKIRKVLEQEGQDKNTIIILMGDNGYFLGERQLAGKWLMYEPSLRVPLIIYDPRSSTGGSVKDLVLNVDVPSTILDFASVQIPDTYQGRSLVGYTNAKVSNPMARSSFLCEHLWDFKPIPPSEGVRTEKYKYFRYIKDPKVEELYDLEKDPNEKNNLVNHPTYRSVLNELRDDCDDMILDLSN